ncbi:MAG: alpha/beta hydrolase [Goleter apudmare HA4340-LM2]|nr:alpha/beta hydrolase [Goleter apudmare HA4340-LM2]
MTLTFDQFQHQRAIVNGNINLHYRIGGTGEPVLLLHGWPQHSLMWHTVAPQLAEHFTVITPDLRGAGGSAIPTAGYDKKTMATDIYQLIQQLELSQIYLCGYDLGAGVAYSLAASYPELFPKVVFMEFGLPGFGYETMMQPSPTWDAASNWHLAFFTVPQVAEFAFRGRERELLTWFFWHLSHNESAVSSTHFEEYVRQISKPGALRAGIEYYANVWQDAEDNKKLAQTPLSMPVLAIGGESSGSHYIAQLFEPVAKNVQTAVVPGAGHWLGDENPQALTAILLEFLTSS